MFGRQAGAARHQRHLVRDDEGGIEANAKLPDELCVPGGVGAQVLEELARPGLGDGTDMFDHLLARHADTVVGDGDRTGGLVIGDTKCQRGIVPEQLGVCDRLEAQLVAGIRPVRHQLAQEDFLVPVQGVNHQVEQLFDFSLKTECFFHRRLVHAYVLLISA